MSRHDKRYLEKIGNQWRVVVAVPRSLQTELGTKLKRALHTDSLAVANAKKWSIVELLKRDILRARGETTQDTLVQDAIEMREEAKCWKNDLSHGEIVGFIAEDILGDPVSRDPHTLAPIFDPERRRRADLYVNIATGRSTPLTSLVQQWHEQEVNCKARTKADDMRALRYLEAWVTANKVSPTLEAITRKVAGRFVGDLSKLGEGPRLANRTANKYMSSLSAYWKWLKSRDYVEENVWRGLSLPKEKPKRDEQERPFTDDEVKRLLAGEPHMPELGPIMRIGALTGARIDAIVSLRVKDCEDGAFRFKPQKKELGERLASAYPQRPRVGRGSANERQRAGRRFISRHPGTALGLAKRTQHARCEGVRTLPKDGRCGRHKAREAARPRELPFVPSYVHHQSRTGGHS